MKIADQDWFDVLDDASSEGAPVGRATCVAIGGRMWTPARLANCGGYHQEFQRLHDLDILRSAFLRVDGTTPPHQWPPAD